MKRTNKNLLLFAISTTLCFVGVLSAFLGCDKSKEQPTTCDVDNPLTDLLWFKEKIDEFNILAQENRSLSIAIYQCRYGNDEIGFWVDEGDIKPFYNCKGEALRTMGGFAEETCSELNIVSKELIWGNDISACGVNSPLQNIGWLKEYCENLNKAQNFSHVYIHLYKIIGTDEHLFKIVINYSGFDSPVGSSTDWKNCTNNVIFSIQAGVPPEPGRLESFLEDKEFVINLFYLVKQ